MTQKINIGAGEDYKKGWINIDLTDKNNADVVFNLNDILKGNPLPFKDNTIDYIYCGFVLEDFLEPIPILDEFLRVLKVGGMLEIKVPFETTTFVGNMCHKRAYTLMSFYDYYEKKNAISNNYNQKLIPISIVSMKYILNSDGGIGKWYFYPYKWIGKNLYNALGFRVVEFSFLKYIFPCVELQVIYKKEDKKK